MAAIGRDFDLILTARTQEADEFYSDVVPAELSPDARLIMRQSLAGAAKDHPPLAWTGGHEHVLQVIESPQWGRVLVSGTGIFGHTSPVKDVPGSLYHASRAGYMRIDWLRDGTRRLGVIEVAKDGSFHESFAKRLDDAPIGR